MSYKYINLFFLPLLASASDYQTGQLTAADVDDNLNFAWFLKFQDRKNTADQCENCRGILPKPYLRDRIPIQVLDSVGNPFSCAEVQVNQKTLPAATNGKLAVFPTLDNLGSGPWQVTVRPPEGTCPQDCLSTTLEATSTSTKRLGDGRTLGDMQGDLRDTVRFSITNQASSLPTKMDLLLLMDTTGSMCDELSYLKSELGEILKEAAPGIDVQLAYIAYKSAGDTPYDVSVSPFGTVPSFAEKLETERCTGGGSGELVNKALAAASELNWREGNVARLALIVGDEPPHGDLKRDMQEAFNAALGLRSSGVRVYGLAASGADSNAEFLFRLVSFITQARYLWLTDDSGIGNPHAEPDVLCYQVIHLDKLLYLMLRYELTGERVEPDASYILRQVGNMTDGVCIYDLNDDKGEGDTTENTDSGSNFKSAPTSGSSPNSSPQTSGNNSPHDDRGSGSGSGSGSASASGADTMASLKMVLILFMASFGLTLVF